MSGVKEIDREVLELTARIMGDASAAAKALADAARREAAGQRVAFFQSGRTLLVVALSGAA